MSVDVSAVARVLGITTEYKDLRGSSVVFLPQVVAVVGQGTTALNASYTTVPTQYTSASAVGTEYGFGSPLHLAAEKLFPTNGDGIGTVPAYFYPLKDDASGVASTGDITPSGTPTAAATIYVYVGEVRSEAITITTADNTVALMCDKIHAGIAAIPKMPMTSADNTTDVGLTSKWEGLSANDIKIRIDGTVPGVTLALTQPSGGLANPDVTTATDQMTTRWETMVLNCLNPTDTTALDAFQTLGEGRWGTLQRKPFVCFTGEVQADHNDIDDVTNTRTDDRVNSYLVAPGSGEMPFMVAARQLARIVKRANNDPAYDYGALRADGLEPGVDADQWTYAARDAALKKGISTIEVVDGVINCSDIITMYRPAGDPLPAYRHVVDIVKLQNVIFNLELIFATAAWNGAPLLPDGDATVNRNAKTPGMAVAAVNSRIDALALAAILSDPATAKASTRAWIDSQNPKRLNVETTVQLSGNTNIVSIDLNFGFYFGQAALVA
jgi:phage tail sheath gpL-like